MAEIEIYDFKIPEPDPVRTGVGKWQSIISVATFLNKLGK